MTDTESTLAERLLTAETKIEMLNNELYALMAITATVLVRCSDDPHQTLESLRADLRGDDELSVIDAVGVLVDHVRAARGQG